MLNAIRVRNLRSLHDTGLIRIRPITILVGENSSGKSTFLRTFPLLKQSAETNTRSSILWFGKYVDFGDFDQAKARTSKSKEIIFSFEIAMPTGTLSSPIHFFRQAPKSVGTTEVVVDLRLAPKGKDGLTRTSGINLEIEGNEIRIEISETGKVSEIEINKTDYSEFSDCMIYVPASGLLPTLRAKPDKPSVINYDWRETFSLPKVNERLIDSLKKFSHGNADGENY